MLANDKIVNAIIDSLSIEDLEQLLEKKRKVLRPEKISEEEAYRMRFESWFKAKMFPPPVM